MSGHLFTILVGTHHTPLCLILDAVGIVRIVEAAMNVARRRRKPNRR
jgi:hypothetical protein